MTMPSVDPRTGFRFTYLILGFSVVAAIGSYFYSLWATSQQENAMLPVLLSTRSSRGSGCTTKRQGNFRRASRNSKPESGGIVRPAPSVRKAVAFRWRTTTTSIIWSIPPRARSGPFPSTSEGKKDRRSFLRSLLKQPAAGRERLWRSMKSSNFPPFLIQLSWLYSASLNNNRFN
jgi:hypothetical protein